MAGRWRLELLEQVVEIAILGTLDKRVDLGPGIDQRRAVGVSGVADSDVAAGQQRHLNAASLRVAVPALLPPDLAQLCVKHGNKRPIIVNFARYRHDSVL